MSKTEMQHTIKAVSKRTGLTPHVIRIWEKRYGAVVPNRNQTNRRFYSDEEVERLLLLREAVNQGHSISSVAQLPSEKLEKLVGEAMPTTPQSAATSQDKAQQLIEAATEAVRATGLPQARKSFDRRRGRTRQPGISPTVCQPVGLSFG